MFKGHAEVCGENFEVEAHDEQIRADERNKIIRLLNDHKEYGMIGYEDIRVNRIIDGIIEHLEKEQKNEV